LLGLDPGNLRARLDLAEIYSRHLGDHAAAARELRRYLERYEADDEHRRQVEQMLLSVRNQGGAED
jgi:cytochrome c-type biogenesis protein CcmH/NrfG